MDPRVIPPAALRDTNSVEMARIWIAEQGLHCSLKIGMYAEQDGLTETRAWGIILADIAGHVADALSADGLAGKAELLEAIIDSFNDEVSAPSSGRTGEAASKGG